MTRAQRWGKWLLGAHLFVCLIWLFLLRVQDGSLVPEWMSHVALWSILGVQFSWGFTVGLLVGPARARRQWLWWSLLLSFLPLYPIGWLIFGLTYVAGPLIALIYLTIFAMILACETYCGVLLGAKYHTK